MIEQELMFLNMQVDMDELDLKVPNNFEATCDVYSKTCKLSSYLHFMFKRFEFYFFLALVFIIII